MLIRTEPKTGRHRARCADCGNDNSRELDIAPEPCNTFCNEHNTVLCFARLDVKEYARTMRRLFS